MSPAQPLPIEAFLCQHDLVYARYDHPAVFTCEEADRHVPPMDAARTKNVFLTDKKGKRHFLVVVGYEKSIDLAALGPLLDAERLRLASAERLLAHLGVEPGAVTLLALINDKNHAVEVFLDRPIWEAASARCHPLVNTSTFAIPQEDMRRFYALTGHSPRVLDIPGRDQASDSSL